MNCSKCHKNQQAKNQKKLLTTPNFPHNSFNLHMNTCSGCGAGGCTNCGQDCKCCQGGLCNILFRHQIRLKGKRVNILTCCKQNQEMNLKINAIHEMQSLDELRKVIKDIQEDPDQVETLIVLTYDSQQSHEKRKYGFKTCKYMAEQAGILLREVDMSSMDTKEGQLNLVSSVANLMLYVLEGGKNNPDPKFQRIWSRYLHANSNIKMYQRLFTKQGCLFTKTTDMELAPFEENTIFPVSLQNLTMSKDLDLRMREVTRDQTLLWAKISADYKWQKNAISK